MIMKTTHIFHLWQKTGLGLTMVVSMMLLSCHSPMPDAKQNGRLPAIFPDYADITIPPNIAPLNFIIHELGDRYIAIFSYGTKNFFSIQTGDSVVKIPAGKWKKLMNAARGNDYTCEIMIRNDGKWTRFLPIVNHVAKDSIDSYLVYRLIDPGFEIWNQMGIYQRCLENFDQQPVMINDLSDGNCMNCHAFCKNSSSAFMFHMRAKNAGTIILRQGRLEKVDTKTPQTISPGVYPSWHPGGRYIAFSVNRIVQRFHALPGKRIEVQDTLSDIVLYDCATHTISADSAIASKSRLETFPNWSPDGKFLYFCSARMIAGNPYDKMKYDLLRISFDAASKRFGAIDTVVSASKTGMSISFPRVSPDGKYLMFCMAPYGNFSIWHKESDLYLLNLATNDISKPMINSEQSESYHSWSSSGRWIVFSSRRIDGLYTRPYFSYFDSTGAAHKPFLLPQKDPGFYNSCMKSFNIPELVTGRIDLDPRDLAPVAKEKAIPSSFEQTP